MEFKKNYDANTALTDVMPELVAAYPEIYEGVGLQDLAQRMHEEIARSGLLRNMDKAFTLLPDQVSTPRATYASLVKGEIEQVAVRESQDRIVAVQVVPYPPGIPLIMPGETVRADKKPIIDYLLAMEQFDTCFPGFEHDNHGIEIERDAQHGLTYKVYVVKQ
jgi:arginine decarboxylase